MSEPPRPPGDADSGLPPDPTAPRPHGSDPASGSPPPPYEPPPTSGAGYPPPSSGASGYPPPSSGASGYPPPPGDAGYPPGGGAAPPPGYGSPPGYAAPGYGAGSGDDRNWAMIAHFGGALGAFVSGGILGWVGPLIALLARGEQSPVVRAHAVSALNFQLLWSIIAFLSYFVSWCLLFIPSIIIIAVQVIIGVVAGVKAANGEPYRYPMSANMIK
jgi:uncharacterized Tic20 family protein